MALVTSGKASEEHILLSDDEVQRPQGAMTSRFTDRWC